ncbi:MAG: GIN domain-containing protein [Janthinobacterium lividum]
MKKTISINLQGILFYIEDDGYDVLSRYLQEVKAHFASYQGHEEIVADIEGRIAELFAARTSAAKQVITLADVEEMTAKMGHVSDFNTAPDEDDEPEPTQEPGGLNGTFGPNGPFGPKGTFGPEGTFGPNGPFAIGRDANGQPRRLYRDLAHRKIAGVCAGLGQYFMVNPLVFRVLGLVLVLLPGLFGHRFPFPGIGFFNRSFDLGGLVVVAYIILWIVLPKRTDAPAPIDTLDLGGPLRGRKLFRDTRAGKVGGVAAGLAAYFQTDVVLVRVLLLAGLFAGGSSFIAYLILWVVVPEARTVSEKMQMRGDDVTLSGIDTNLRATAFDADTTMPVSGRPMGTFLEGAARGAQPAVNFLGTLIRWGVAGLLIFMGGSWLFSVVVALGAALSIIPFTAVEHTSNGFVPDDSFGAVVRNLPPWGAVAGALMFGIPALAVILLGLRLILRRSVIGRSAGLLAGLWVLGLVGSAAAGVQVLRDFQSKGTYTTTVRLAAASGPGMVLDSRNIEGHFQWVDFQLAPADSNAAPYVEEEFRANGRTQDAARLTAQQTMNYRIDQRDSTITFDQGTTLKENAPFRNQKLALTLYLPLNKTYRLTPLFIEHLDDDDFASGHRPKGNATHRARFTREGKFVCLDCPPSNDDDDDNDNGGDETVNVDVNGHRARVSVNTDGDEPTVRVHTDDEQFNTDPDHYGSARKPLTNPGSFTEIEVRSALQVVVRQGDTYKVEAAGRAADLDDVHLSVEGDRLVLRQRGSGLFSGSNRPVLVQVTLPTLRHLELHEASQADVSGFRNDDLRLEASGASQARLDVQVPRLELKLSSASQADVSGTATELTIDSGSASQVDAKNLRAERVTLDLGSGSQASVQATEELKADLSSGSSATYSGHPKRVEKDLSSGSSLDEE